MARGKVYKSSIPCLAMAIDIPVALDDLARIIAKIKELLEWARLEQQEARPEVPPSFRLSNHADEDLRLQCGLFVSKDLALRLILNTPSPSTPAADKAQWQRELHHLEEEVRALGLAERFISP